VSTDVLRWPVLGGFLRWRHARTACQLLLLSIAAVVLLDGFAGSTNPSGNLAPLLVWVHFRGFLILALLAAGNLFCFGCPLVLARDTARRVVTPRFHWPRRLRTKWFALALFVIVLFSYELFDLWALPAATAYLVLIYFAAAVTIDVVFSGATFCKYVCPIGQFNFVASTVSPLELRVADQSTCRSCRTADCIKGRRAPSSPLTVVRRGCELGLFLPAKVGNLDCTFCLDCVQACPHDNIELATRTPASELTDLRRRSGLGRLLKRPDLAALATLFVFGGLLNAFAMVASAYRLEAWMARLLGFTSEAPVLALVFAGMLVVVPAVLLGSAVLATRRLARPASLSVRDIALRYTYALVPLGFGVWTAHYGFHLLTGLFTVVPMTQRAVTELIGTPLLGEPLWRWTGMRPGSVFPIQLGCILLGAMGSLALSSSMAETDYPERSGIAAIPWMVVTAAVAGAAIWILLQPMEMRGTGLFG
jgi:ferredoxin